MSMKRILKFIWRAISIIYFPVYIAFWLLHKIARIFLAISYFGMLEKQMGKDIIFNLLYRYGRH